MLVVYFTSISNNTEKFAVKLGYPTKKISVKKSDTLTVTEAYILVTPTYASRSDPGVPKQVIHFLNNPVNRNNLKGVVGGGNRNFGSSFAIAADVIAEKCGVPVLHKFEIAGDVEDVSAVHKSIESLNNDPQP